MNEEIKKNGSELSDGEVENATGGGGLATYTCPKCGYQYPICGSIPPCPKCHWDAKNHRYTGVI